MPEHKLGDELLDVRDGRKRHRLFEKVREFRLQTAQLPVQIVPEFFVDRRDHFGGFRVFGIDPPAQFFNGQRKALYNVQIFRYGAVVTEENVRRIAGGIYVKTAARRKRPALLLVIKFQRHITGKAVVAQAGKPARLVVRQLAPQITGQRAPGFPVCRFVEKAPARVGEQHQLQSVDDGGFPRAVFARQESQGVKLDHLFLEKVPVDQQHPLQPLHQESSPSSAGPSPPVSSSSPLIGSSASFAAPCRFWRISCNCRHMALISLFGTKNRMVG